MKRKISIYVLYIIVLMGIVFITSDYTYADNFDFYHNHNYEIDYDYYHVLNNDTVYYRLINNYDTYFQEFEQHYYNLREISDYRVENRNATTTEVMDNINKYLAAELGIGRELIDKALYENTLDNPIEFYTDDSYNTYKGAYDYIIALKDNRFIILEDLLDSIEALEISYLNLTPRENIINDYVVTYKIGNEIIGTETVKEGDNPINVPFPEKEGYTFSHWTWNGEDLSNEEIENIEVTGNIDFQAVMIPKSYYTYTIKYINRQGDEWSVDLSAEYQDEVTADDIKEIEIIKDNQQYIIENIDKESIIIDDKSENNLFHVNVYKVYPINEHQDLINILEDANLLTRPNYSEGNEEWNLYWNQLIEAKNEFKNTLITEDNIEEIKGNLVENIGIIKIINDFDLAWGDRETPLGFAETINRQAQSSEYFGRLKVYFNRYTSIITIGMSDEQKDKSFAGGALGVGVRTAMINVLKSENLYTVKSRGVEAGIRDSDGNLYSESELINRGIDLAYAWLPEGMSPFNNKWGELIGIEPVEFIMAGKTTPNGQVFTRTYYFEFVDINDI